MITLIAAVEVNLGIGLNGQLLCHLPEDLAHFQKTTKGFPVIMGRKTWQSLPSKLKGRTNIVLSSQSLSLPEGVFQCRYLGEALSLAQKINPKEQFIIGGGEIFKDALPLASRIILTHILHSFKADAFFPPLHGFNVFSKTEVLTSKTGLRYQIIEYRPKNNLFSP
jgi:dihydrofolate reductase